MRKPLIILVSGAPGSGKTILAHNLAEYLRLPHIPRDEILRGIEMTQGGAIDRGGIGIETYYSLLAHLCESKISFVTDGTIYKGISEVDISRLKPIAEVINVHARAQNEYERFIKREASREGWSSEWVAGHMNKLEEIYEQAVDPLDLGVPVIEVDASDGYNPSIIDIVEYIREQYADTREGVQPEVTLSRQKQGGR